MILALRTDAPTVDIILLSDKGEEVAHERWQADRTLARDLHAHIQAILRNQDSDWHELKGVLVFRGPGSFTGLRIGITVANTLGYGLAVPVVGSMGDDWQKTAFARWQAGDNDRVVLPDYGSDAHITTPKK